MPVSIPSRRRVDAVRLLPRALIVLAALPTLLGARSPEPYVEPVGPSARIVFTQTASPVVTVHADGRDCSKMVELPDRFDFPAETLNVAAGQPIAFKLFQFKGIGSVGGNTSIRGCHVATSFVPAADAEYRVHLDGLACRIEVFLRHPADGSETPESSARARKVKPPLWPTGPFCKGDAEPAPR